MVDDPWVHAVELVLDTNTTTSKHVGGLIRNKLDDVKAGKDSIRQDGIRKMVAICSDALLKAMSEVFGCSSAHLKGYCSDFLPNSHLQFFQIVWPTSEHNLEELKMRIQEEIAAIPLEMCRRAAEKNQTSPSTVHRYRWPPSS
ncbi:hypothetical protein Pcinc_000777 [Petrolisthes cinctipes]|uniref:Uncharacterized protein n=1 Tax=Petrolisthes cinctipes TaxID=88211 RepID=A0AAE1L3R9_PETCI|nr:hypothetical protein Pcinc_000777 [Petrolisthes cinctipes]